MEKGLVSIITPVYNAEKFIGQTIESVLNQTYEKFEYLLVDDQSQDQSASIIKAYQAQDERINLIQLETNSGAAVARNTGIAAANGQYIAFVDSDDCWAPDKLEAQLQFMQANHYAFTYTGFSLVDEVGNTIKEATEIPVSLNYHQLLKNTAIACSTVVIDRQIVGDFRMPLVRKGQDTATWLMLMRERKVTAHGLNQVLNHYRQVEGSISSDRWGALKRTWNTYYRLEKLPLPKACYYFAWYVFNAIRRRL